MPRPDWKSPLFSIRLRLATCIAPESGLFACAAEPSCGTIGDEAVNLSWVLFTRRCDRRGHLSGSNTHLFEIFRCRPPGGKPDKRLFTRPCFCQIVSQFIWRVEITNLTSHQSPLRRSEIGAYGVAALAPENKPTPRGAHNIELLR
jgi:hypothetical protein